MILFGASAAALAALGSSFSLGVAIGEKRAAGGQRATFGWEWPLFALAISLVVALGLAAGDFDYAGDPGCVGEACR